MKESAGKGKALIRTGADWIDMSLIGNSGAGAMAVLKLPSDAAGQRALGSLVEEDLDKFLAARLSSTDLEKWRACQPERWSDADKIRIWSGFDYVVIERAQTLGWRIFESAWVRARIQHWHDGGRHGVERLRKLFRAVELSANVTRGKAKFPIAARERAEWRNQKKKAVAELRVLLRQHRNQFNQRRGIPMHHESREWFLDTITKSAQSFRFLAQNLQSFLRYLDYLQKHDVAHYRQIVLGEETPAFLFDSWVAWGRNLSPESFRQAISKV